MDYLQYKEKEREMDTIIGVLNLIINGLPSIQLKPESNKFNMEAGF